MLFTLYHLLIIFHVVGEFTVFEADWEEIERNHKNLKQRKVLIERKWVRIFLLIIYFSYLLRILPK